MNQALERAALWLPVLVLSIGICLLLSFNFHLRP